MRALYMPRNSPGDVEGIPMRALLWLAYGAVLASLLFWPMDDAPMPESVGACDDWFTCGLCEEYAD